jgi:hypothetical protein
VRSLKKSRTHIDPTTGHSHIGWSWLTVVSRRTLWPSVSRGGRGTYPAGCQQVTGELTGDRASAHAQTTLDPSQWKGRFADSRQPPKAGIYLWHPLLLGELLRTARP